MSQESILWLYQKEEGFLYVLKQNLLFWTWGDPGWIQGGLQWKMLCDIYSKFNSTMELYILSLTAYTAILGISSYSLWTKRMCKDQSQYKGWDCAVSSGKEALESMAIELIFMRWVWNGLKGVYIKSV